MAFNQYDRSDYEINDLSSTGLQGIIQGVITKYIRPKGTAVRSSMLNTYG